jgi:hypothetical protein
MTIDRTTRVSDILSLIGAPRAYLDVGADRRGIIAPIADPDDAEGSYMDYLRDNPEAGKRLLAARDAPRSEDEDIPEDWRNV